MKDKLKIVYRPLKELTPYARNARTHSDEQVAQLVASIAEFGWTNPVLIDENGDIIAGHGRVLAAEAIGIVSVPTIKLTGLTYEQKRAYRLAENRLSLNAGWDSDLLKLEVTDLLDADFNLPLTGFTQQEIDDQLVVIETPGGGEDPYTTKIDSPVTIAQGFSVEGIYSGSYDVRVRALNVQETSSSWGYADNTFLSGKQGKPGTPTNFRATDNVVWNIYLAWGFPEGSGDTAFTEILGAKMGAKKGLGAIGGGKKSFYVR